MADDFQADTGRGCVELRVLDELRITWLGLGLGLGLGLKLGLGVGVGLG